MQKNYELERDYILDVLEEEEDKLTKEINENLPEPIKFEFKKFLAVRNEIERINIQNALNQGINNLKAV